MNKPGKISASMMCANPFHLAQIMRTLEEGGVEYLHQDIMDGKFVPNLGMSREHMIFVRKCTSIPFDFHLMTLEPDNIVQLLEPQPGDMVSIHYESTCQVQRTLENVRRWGCKVFIAINPATSLSALEEVIYYVDGINLLMVNPGFAGQTAVASTFDKAKRLTEMLKAKGREDIELEVDGNITFESAARLRTLGASIFVAGSSSIFTSEGVESARLETLRRSIA